MLLHTTRFGNLHVASEDLFSFPAGLIGFEQLQQWVLLADAQNDAVGWLQSASHADIAIAVVSPRRFVPDYRVHVAQSNLASLELGPAGKERKSRGPGHRRQPGREVTRRPC